jgi:acetolactate synthase-1/2/3 large subunit
VQNQSAIVASVTKWSALARSPGDVPRLVREACCELRAGRPRPVAVEIPPDVLSARAEVTLVEPPADEDGRLRPSPASIEQAARMLEQARFPVLYCGGGVLAANGSEALERVADKLQAPVVMSDYGRGALSDRHPLALNSLGGRAVFPHADVVLVVGSRFSDSVTAGPAWPQENIRYIYMNADPKAWEAPRVPALAIESDAGLGLAALADALAGGKPSRAGDMARVRSWCEQQQRQLEPQWSWTQALRASIPEDGVLVHDLTQVCYYARAFYPLYRARTSLSPGHQGTLGFAFPAALGAAAGGRAVVCATGDGGFGFGLAELATAAKYGLGVVALVFNDGEFTNIKTMHTAAFGRVTGSELRNPDFAKLAEAFGVAAACIRSPQELQAVLPRAIASGRPWLIDAQVSDMPSPWHLLRLRATTQIGRHRPPPNPLGEPAS